MNENFEENPNPSSFDNLDHPSPFNNPEPQYPAPRKRSPRKFLYLLGGVVVVLILLNVVRVLTSKSSKAPSPTPTPTFSFESPSPTEQPSPTESASPTASPVSSVDKTSGLDRAKLSVQIENGSGVAGAAGKASDLLKSLGYDVVGAGNADNFNYIGVTIKVKSSAQGYIPVLNKDLSSNSYTVGSSSADLTATSSADALVIIGK